MQMHALTAEHALAYVRQKLFLKADKHDQNCLKETDVSSVSFFYSTNLAERVMSALNPLVRFIKISCNAKK